MTEFNERLCAAFPDKRIVPGDGRSSAPVVLVGEAPGENEEKQLKPFVGKAGAMLDEFLALSGIERTELYITNAVKFRPTAVGKSGRPINRKPTAAEITAFRPWLMEELALIKPVCVVTLGNVPLSVFTGSGTPIGSVHGNLLNCEGFTVYPMYHPASVIYNRALREVYVADVQKLGGLVNECLRSARLFRCGG